MTEDRNNMVNNHGYQFTEMLTGIDVVADSPFFPTPHHYARKLHGDKATNCWYLNPVSYFRQWNCEVYDGTPGLRRRDPAGQLHGSEHLLRRKQNVAG